MDEFDLADVFGLVDFRLISNNKDRFSEESISAGIKLYDDGVRNPPHSINYSRDNFAYFERKHYVDLFDSVMKLSPDPLLAKEFLSVVAYKAMKQAAFEMSTFEVSSGAYSEIDLDLVEDDEEEVESGYIEFEDYTFGKFEELREKLINKRVVKWEEYKLTLDDGTELGIVDVRDDYSGTTDGEFYNVKLDALITDVSYPEFLGTDIDAWGDSISRARVTLFHNRNHIAQVNFEAERNPWYYSIACLEISGVNYKILDYKGLIEEDELNDK